MWFWPLTTVRTCSDFQQLQPLNSITFTAMFNAIFCLHPIVCAAVATVYEHSCKLRILELSFNDPFAKIFPCQFCKPKMANPKWRPFADIAFLAVDRIIRRSLVK